MMTRAKTLNYCSYLKFARCSAVSLGTVAVADILVLGGRPTVLAGHVVTRHGVHARWARVAGRAVTAVVVDRDMPARTAVRTRHTAFGRRWPELHRAVPEMRLRTRNRSVVFSMRFTGTNRVLTVQMCFYEPRLYLII